MRTAFAVVSVAAFTAAASAQTWTFDAPSFTLGETTPLLNRAPNVGPMTMTASFETVMDPMLVEDAASFQPNGLFSGGFLLVDGGDAALLTITFSQPVTSVSFDFAVNAVMPGFQFLLYTDNDSQSYAPGFIGGGFGAWGGHVDYSHTTPFSFITLVAISPSSEAVEYAIDNVAIPTPSAAAALGLAGVASLRRRRR